MADEATAPTKSGRLADAALVRLAIRFLLCFAALFGLIVWLSARTPFINDVQLATAEAATGLMNLTGAPAVRDGTLILVGARQLQIGADCTGLTIAAMLISLMLSYPVKASTKVTGIVAGILAILLANLLRLVMIAHLAGAPDVVFYTAHDFLFQVGMVVVAIAVWAAWLSYARARES